MTRGRWLRATAKKVHLALRGDLGFFFLKKRSKSQGVSVAATRQSLVVVGRGPPSLLVGGDLLPGRLVVNLSTAHIIRRLLEYAVV